MNFFIKKHKGEFDMKRKIDFFSSLFGDLSGEEIFHIQ